MERRIRSFAARPRHRRARATTCAVSRNDDDRARAVPRPGHDQRLAALAQPRAVERARGERMLPELAAAPARSTSGAPAARTAPRRTRSRRSVSSRTRRARSRSSAPTSTARMIERARGGWFSAEDARTAPPRAARHAGSSPPTAEPCVARPELRRPRASRRATCCACRSRAGATTSSLCRNTVIYFAEPVRDELHARLASALRPGGYLLIGSTERVSDSSGIGLEPVRPFLYRKAA